MAGKNLAGKAYGANFFCIQVVTAKAQMIFEKGIIEVHVVCYKYIALQQGKYPLGYFLKAGCVLHHFVGYAGKCLDITGNNFIGVDERFKPLHYVLAVKNLNRNFDDAVGGRVAARRFNVHNGVMHRKVFLRRKGVEVLKKSRNATTR